MKISYKPLFYSLLQRFQKFVYLTASYEGWDEDERKQFESSVIEFFNKIEPRLKLSEKDFILRETNLLENK